MTNNYLHIFRRPPLLFVFLMAMTTLVSCGYSVWYYDIVEEKLNNNESWSFWFLIGRHGSTPPATEISPDDTLSYAFSYAIVLKEKDTTKYERLYFRVDNIQISYSHDVEAIKIEKISEDSRLYEHDGTTAVDHHFYYGPFLLPMPLSDTIWFEQDVTVFYRDSKEEITSFHHVVKAELIEGKYSHLRDFIRGT